MIEYLKNLFIENPATAAVVATLGATSFTGLIYLLRDTLKKWGIFISTHFFVSISFDNSTDLFGLVAGFLMQYKGNVIKNFLLINESYPDSFSQPIDNLKLGVNDTYSFFRIGLRLYKFTVVSESLENSLQRRYIVRITTFGFSEKPIEKLLKTIVKYINESGYIYKIGSQINRCNNVGKHEKYRPINNYVEKEISKRTTRIKNGNQDHPMFFYDYFDGAHFINIDPRPFSSIFLADKIKEQIINRINTFLKGYAFYKENNIPYHLGIILYGPPGTGKSSIIKAIAHHFNFDIHNIATNDLVEFPRIIGMYNDTIKREKTDVIKQMFLDDQRLKVEYDVDIKSYIFKDKILSDKPELAMKEFSKNYDKYVEEADSVLEDFMCKNEKKGMPLFVFEDIDGSALVKNRDAEIKYNRKVSEDEKQTVSVNMGSILNAMDGINTPGFFIMIATTNHIEAIDPAFKRPGRFDIAIEIPYVCDEVYRKFFSKFYPFGKLPEKLNIKKDLTVSKLQEYVLGGMDYKEFLKKTVINNKKGEDK